MRCANGSKILRIVFLVFSVVLALGAFLIAAGDNVSQDNPLVKFVLDFRKNHTPVDGR